MRATHARAALCGIGLFVSGCELGSESFLYLPPPTHDKPPSRLNRPPVLSLVFAAPLETDLGSRITLSAAAEDPDGDPVAFRWTATGGVIAKPRNATTVYVCKEPGEHAVVIRVTDPRGADDTIFFTVSCV